MADSMHDDSPDLSDSTEALPLRLPRVDWSSIANPVVLGAAGGVIAGMALLIWPDRGNIALARIVGIGLAWWAVTTTLTRRRDGVSLTRAIGPLAGLVVAAVLLVNPNRSTVFLGRSVGVLLLAYVLRSIVEIVRRDERDWAGAPFLSVVGAIGALMLVATGETFSIVIAILAIGLVGVSLLTLIVSLDSRTEGVADFGGTQDLVMRWIRDRPKSLEARQDLYGKILYEGDVAGTRVVRFFALMGFAAVIASMGVITDSTAVVIGAMLVAPLMTPLMGMAISLVMGWPVRLARSAALAAGGIVFAIAIGFVLGLVVPTDIDTASSAQILARSNPTVLDLITAIAAGGAGAYGLSRPDVSDSLPGVAIAISLVPPLTVVGIAWSQGDVTAGTGSFLLFATNMIAILIVGGLTFVLTGVTPIDQAATSGERVRTAIGATATVAVLVIGALLLNGAQIASDALNQDTVQETIEGWLPADTSHRVVRSSIDDGVVSAVIIGPSDGLADVDQLAADLSDSLNQGVDVRISLVVEELLQSSG